MINTQNNNYLQLSKLNSCQMDILYEQKLKAITMYIYFIFSIIYILNNYHTFDSEMEY